VEWAEVLWRDWNSAMKPLRCAVYTRKSTEDGLEQEFNSLDAQREACESYIMSQRHEGWSPVSTRYDDGGFSGGSMQRPGLQALLADIDAGKVDVIVVYKVDRLTRSLADFAKIVERLDAKEASFVSVTQAFNTTTSMGRLTLNVLLSFAQFEREVTGERIRDKIAASKKKGLWMGGPVPLGYEVLDRKLLPQPQEAERVRTIMRRYLELPSAPALIARLEAEGVLTKIQARTSGPHKGGIPFRRGSLFYLLKNPVYRGKIVHRKHVYDGEHEPIIDEELWNAVQTKLASKAPPRKRKTNDPQNVMLRGLLIDPEGRPMVPCYTSKGSRRYQYYQTRKDLAKPADAVSTRFPIHQLDRHIISNLKMLLADQHSLRHLSGSLGAELNTIFIAAANCTAQLDQQHLVHTTVRSLVSAIRVAPDHLRVALNALALGVPEGEPWQWSIPLPERKPFREAKLRIDAQQGNNGINQSLLALLGEAYRVQKIVLASPELGLNQIATREGKCRKHMTKLLRISWLSPFIVDAIVDGRQPRMLSRKTLLDQDLPIIWKDQESLLGFVT
jgi:site-specific DNA recombinase